MVTLEQIKLLESKLTRAINFVSQLSEENSRLKKRNDELEEVIVTLKEEKARVEEGIASALGKLNQFEDVIERSLSSVKTGSKSEKPAAQSLPKPEAQTPPPKPDMPPPPPKPAAQTPPPKPAVQGTPKPVVASAYTVDEEEKPEDDPEEDITEELIEDSGEAELDIF